MNEIKYVRTEGKNPITSIIINTTEDMHATWITTQDETGKTFTYGEKAFKKLYKKVA